jgi:hypothetical protein
MNLGNILFAIGGVVFGTIVTAIKLHKENYEQQKMINKLNEKLVFEKTSKKLFMKMYEEQVRKNVNDKYARDCDPPEEEFKKIEFDNEPIFPGLGRNYFVPGGRNKNYCGMRKPFEWTKTYYNPCYLPYSARKELENNKEVKNNDEI